LYAQSAFSRGGYKVYRGSLSARREIDRWTASLAIYIHPRQMSQWYIFVITFESFFRDEICHIFRTVTVAGSFPLKSKKLSVRSSSHSWGFQPGASLKSQERTRVATTNFISFKATKLQLSFIPLPQLGRNLPSCFPTQFIGPDNKEAITEC
jgi:hypothetical protein